MGVPLAFILGEQRCISRHQYKKQEAIAYIKNCQDISGKELFQYYDEEGNRKSIDSGMVNEYIKEISDGDFTAKDFRTWAGTLQALIAFKSYSFN
jgi:DNA topoisomerase-1